MKRTHKTGSAESERVGQDEREIRKRLSKASGEFVLAEIPGKNTACRGSLAAAACSSLNAPEAE